MAGGETYDTPARTAGARASALEDASPRALISRSGGVRQWNPGRGWNIGGRGRRRNL